MQQLKYKQRKIKLNKLSRHIMFYDFIIGKKITGRITGRIQVGIRLVILNINQIDTLQVLSSSEYQNK